MTKPLIQIDNVVREMTDSEYEQWQTDNNDPSQYQRDRAAEYPAMADYLDGIVKGDQAQVQAYIDACLAVKTKYPKPSQT